MTTTRADHSDIAGDDSSTVDDTVATEDTATTDIPIAAPETADGEGTRPPLWRRLARSVRHRLRGRFVPVAVGILMIAALIAAATAYLTMYRGDNATRDGAARDVVGAANDGTVAILSYSPKSLDADFTEAKTHLTGQFLTYYKEFTAKVVKPAATENGVDTKAQVVRSAVSDLSPDNAQVLAFVNQTTRSKTKPEPELTSSSVRISLQKVDGKWLISSFDPV
ncbi:hypothetical protein AAFP35_21180 [Gordonia sp. CPCC 206044]|uniref:hypothetical protein n=1 Tax=Gordonia sp. CPCC 206044 TaxID=3140793 RepID=UPI003AF3BB73